MNKKLIIVGCGEFGQIAYEYFSKDSEYDVCGFAVEERYFIASSFNNLPVIRYEQLEESFSPEQYSVFVAVTYTNFNNSRKRLIEDAKSRGYALASYICSNCFVGNNALIGDNVFIFENCSIQHGCSVGDGTIIFAGGIVAHSSSIGMNCWLAPGVAVSGFCKIGDNSFLGVHASIGDNVSIAKYTLIGAGAAVYKNIDTPEEMYVGVPARRLDKSPWEHFC